MPDQKAESPLPSEKFDLGRVVRISAADIAERGPAGALIRGVRAQACSCAPHRVRLLLDLRSVPRASPLIADPLRLRASIVASGAGRWVILVDDVVVLMQCASGMRVSDPVLLLDTSRDREWVKAAELWLRAGAACV